MSTCAICLEPVRVPVQPTCFHCRFTTHGERHRHADDMDGEEIEGEQTNSDNDVPVSVASSGLEDMSCFSVQRVCFWCFLLYMDGDKPMEAMKADYKCLFCPARRPAANVVTHRTRGTLCRVDFTHMSFQPALCDTACPSMCGAALADQMSLYRHLREVCPRTPVTCACGAVMTRARWAMHRDTCGEYATCQLCEERVHRRGLSEHCFHQHRHIICYMCGLPVSIERTARHFADECVNRPQLCTVCLQMVRQTEWEQHVRDHLRHIREAWEHQQTFVQRATQELSLLRTLLLERGNAQEADEAGSRDDLREEQESR